MAAQCLRTAICFRKPFHLQAPTSGTLEAMSRLILQLGATEMWSGETAAHQAMLGTFCILLLLVASFVMLTTQGPHAAPLLSTIDPSRGEFGVEANGYSSKAAHGEKNLVV